MSVFDGLMSPAAVGGAFAQGLESGRQVREEREGRSALAAFASNPTEANFAAAAQYDPRLAYTMRNDVRSQAAAQAAAAKEAQAEQQKKLGVLADLLDGTTDEASYQRGLRTAQYMGIDVSGAPQAYDPEWVGMQRQIVALAKDKPDELKGIAYELEQAGYKPGTPEYQAAARSVISNKYATEYVDEGGNTRRRSALNLEQPASGIPAEAIAALKRGEGTPEQFDQLFGQGAAAKAMGGGVSNGTGGF